MDREVVNLEIERGPAGRSRFAVKHKAGLTVLGALDQVKAEHDGTLTWRAACRHGMCGSCTMRIQGRPRLACVSLMEDVVGSDGVVRVAPLGGYRVVRDLVVDMDPFFEPYEQARPWLEPRDQVGATADLRENRVSPDEVEALGGADRCLACGACTSVCPVVRLTRHRFVGPAALVKTAGRVFDERDDARAERLREAAGAFGAWRCRTSLDCVAACPESINPALAIARLKQALMAPRRKAPGSTVTRR